MAQIAMDPKHSPELRGRMYAELAQYVAPKRRAVELAGDANNPVTISVAETRRQKRQEYLAQQQAQLPQAEPEW